MSAVEMAREIVAMHERIRVLTSDLSIMRLRYEQAQKDAGEFMRERDSLRRQIHFALADTPAPTTSNGEAGS